MLVIIKIIINQCKQKRLKFNKTIKKKKKGIEFTVITSVNQYFSYIHHQYVFINYCQLYIRKLININRIIKRNLFGVPPPTDKTIFDDAAGLFFNNHIEILKLLM